MTEKTVATPVIPPDGPIYQAINGRKEAEKMAKKSLADLGLTKVGLVYLDSGALRTMEAIVPQETLAAAISLLEDAEVG
jgi:hypothetical protein